MGHLLVWAADSIDLAPSFGLYLRMNGQEKKRCFQAAGRRFCSSLH